MWQSAFQGRCGPFLSYYTGQPESGPQRYTELTAEGNTTSLLSFPDATQAKVFVLIRVLLNWKSSTLSYKEKQLRIHIFMLF